jgi:hypothetical protein
MVDTSSPLPLRVFELVNVGVAFVPHRDLSNVVI